MTRERAAQALVRMRAGIEDTLAYEQHSAKGYRSLYEDRDALQMGAEALMPWVRTAERKPTLADANKDGCVYAYDVSGYKQIDGQIGRPGIHVMHYQTVRIHHASFLWWSSIPPLPEVEP